MKVILSLIMALWTQSVLAQEAELDDAKVNAALERAMCIRDCENTSNRDEVFRILVRSYITGTPKTSAKLPERIRTAIQTELLLEQGRVDTLCDETRWDDSSLLQERFGFYCYLDVQSYVSDRSGKVLSEGFSKETRLAFSVVHNIRNNRFSLARRELERFREECTRMCYVLGDLRDELQYISGGAFVDFDCTKEKLAQPSSLTVFSLCTRKLSKSKPKYVLSVLDDAVTTKDVSLNIQLVALELLSLHFDRSPSENWPIIEGKVEKLNRKPLSFYILLAQCREDGGLCRYRDSDWKAQVRDQFPENTAATNFLLDLAVTTNDWASANRLSRQLLNKDEFDPLGLSVQCILHRTDRSQLDALDRFDAYKRTGRKAPDYLEKSCVN